MMVLLTYIMAERANQDSFWQPWFEAVELIDLPATWDDELLDKMLDREALDLIKQEKETLKEDWEVLKGIMKLYPDIF